MAACPFLSQCGGCRYDFTAPDYHDKKMAALPRVAMGTEPIWAPAGTRRRADFCFAPGQFGFFQSSSKNIVPVDKCPNLRPEINEILPRIAALPYSGAGSCLVTLCDNGIDVAITSNVDYFTTEFRAAAEKLDAIRVTWNGRTVVQKSTPIIKFGDVAVEYPPNAFLQPGIEGESAMRNLVMQYADGARRVVDLFCGLGNFTYALNADGFDVSGPFTKRDLFAHPLTPGMLKNYDCVVMDPPRAGATAQVAQIVKSDVERVIYVSCNPATFVRDMNALIRGGYQLTALTPVDQFVGSSHWELVARFDRVKK